MAVLAGAQEVLCAFAGSLLKRPGRGSPAWPGDASVPVAVGNACGGSRTALMPSIPSITLHCPRIEGSPKYCHSYCHENQGLNGCPGCKTTLDGGQGRSARSKDRGVPCPSNVDSWLGAKDAVDVACVARIEPQSLLMVTEKNRTYALGNTLQVN